MSIISTGNIAKALVPGVDAFAGLSYKEFPDKAASLFRTKKTIRNFEEQVYMIGTGLATVKSMGTSIDLDDATQHFVTQYRMKTYALGMRINFEAIDDNLYKDQISFGGKMLGRSYRETEQVVAHNILNNAFDSAYVYGDGKELVATDHPFKSGGTWSNELATPANLSQAAIQDLLIQINDLEDDKGKKLMLKATQIHVPTAYQFAIAEILNSTLRSDTAENATNVLKGIFPKGYEVHEYFTSTTAWFITTNAENGLIHFEREAPRIDADNDFLTKDLLFSLCARYAYGATDPRAVFGTAGV